MERIRVLLVDDHTIVRQGLRCILATDDEIEVVGEAGDGRSAVELTERLQPDVVVMDLTLPELNGIEATRRIFKQEKDAKVLRPQCRLQLLLHDALDGVANSLAHHALDGVRTDLAPFSRSPLPAIASHGVILRHPLPSGHSCRPTAPDDDAFLSLFHHTPDIAASVHRAITSKYLH